jgi:hypothetical protein
MALTATPSFAAPVAIPGSMARRWTGRVLSGLAVLFLTFDGVIKLVPVPEAVQSMTELGYPLGVLELLCLALYLVPRTALVGAVLWTGYLGGAITTHLRVESPLFTHTLFPIYVALLLWGGLWLRDSRVSALLAPVGRR